MRGFAPPQPPVPSQLAASLAAAAPRAPSPGTPPPLPAARAVVAAAAADAVESERALGAGGGWQIFMHSIRRFLRCDSPDFTVAHVTGDLWRLRPTATFGGFTRRAISDICLERQLLKVFGNFVQRGRAVLRSDNLIQP